MSRRICMTLVTPILSEGGVQDIPVLVVPALRARQKRYRAQKAHRPSLRSSAPYRSKSHSADVRRSAPAAVRGVGIVRNASMRATTHSVGLRPELGREDLDDGRARRKPEEVRQPFAVYAYPDLCRSPRLIAIKRCERTHTGASGEMDLVRTSIT